MKRKIRVNLQAKVILAGLILALAPLVILTLLNTRNVRQNLNDVANQALTIAAEQTANRIDQFLLENLMGIQAAGQLRPFGQYLKLVPEKRSGSREEADVTTILRTLSQRNLLLPMPYAVLDAAGINVLDTESWRIGSDESREIYFREPFQKGMPYISPILFSPEATRRAFFYVSGPVFNVAGDVVGVLRIQLSTAFLQDFIANTSGLTGPDSFGLLLDQNHFILAHADSPEMVFKTSRPLSDSQFNQLQASGQLPHFSREKLIVDLPAFENKLHSNASRAVFTAPLTPGDKRLDQVAVAGLKQTGWLVVVAQPRDVFLKPIGKQIKSTLWLVSIIAVTVMVLAILVARKLTQPIINMTAIARKIATGDLTAEVPMTSRDELGLLAQSFNDMAGQLRELIGSLEQRVTDLDRAKTALQESKERYRILFEDSPISLWEEDFSKLRKYFDRLRASGITDFRSYFDDHSEAVVHCATLVKIQDVNKATLGLFKAENKEVLMNHLPALFSSQSLEIFRQELITLCEGGQRFEGEITQRTLAGEEIFAILQLSVAPGYEKSWGKVLVSLNDITARKRIEKELAEYRAHLEDLVKTRTAELEAKNKELEVFTYSVSHDLKAPLRGIDGYSRLLVEDYADKLDDEGIQFLNNVRQSTKQMNQLIEDLLSYSRMERRDIQPGSIDLQSIIDVLISQRKQDIETRQIRVSVNWPFKTIVSDNETLRQVLGNYLDNAIKFSKEDEPAIVEVAGEEDHDSWVLWVKDSGIGFDLKYHDRIFNIFQRLQRAEDFPGTGIGLAIVRKAADRIGGQVWAESELGKGSTFFISIPKKHFLLREARIDGAK